MGSVVLLPYLLLDGSAVHAVLKASFGGNTQFRKRRVPESPIISPLLSFMSMLVNYDISSSSNLVVT